MNRLLCANLNAGIARKNNRLRRIIFLLSFFLLGQLPSYAQEYSGLKFTSPASIAEGRHKLGTFQLVAKHFTCVQITMPDYRLDTLFYLEKDSITELNFNHLIPESGGEQDTTPTDYLSFQIHSNYPINAYIKSPHASLKERLIPDDKVESSYNLLNYPISGNIFLSGTYSGSQLAIVGLSDNTTINSYSDIELSHHTGNALNNQPVIRQGLDSIKINDGEILYLGQYVSILNNYYNNLNAIKFWSNNSFKIYTVDFGGAGHDTTLYKTCGPFIVFDEVTHYLDLNLQEATQSHYYCVPANGNGLDFIRVIGLENDTEIFWNDSLVKTLMQGEIWDTCFLSAMEIRSSKAIQLGQFVQNTHIAPKYLETLSISTHGINPNDFFQDILFHADSLNLAAIERWYVNLITELADTDKVVIQGAHQFLSPWQAIGNSGKAWTKLALSSGTYHFQSESKIAAFYYSLGFHQGQVPASIRNPRLSVSYKLQGLSLNENHPFSKFRIKKKEELQVLGKSDTLYTCTDEAFQIISPKMGVSKWRFICSWGDTLYSQNELGLDTFSFHFPQIGNYHILMEDISGCEDPQELFIRIDRAPSINWDYQVVNTCEAKLLELHVDTQAFANYTWIINDQNYNHTELSLPIPANENEIKLQLVQTFYNCLDTINRSIKLDSLPAYEPMPNLISPNGDGINDALCFENLFSAYAPCFEINIANRWGQVVYQSSSLNECWRPENLSAGVYYYQIKLGTEMLKGFIHLQ